MSEAFRSSLEKTMTVMTQDAALDYIARRGSASSYDQRKRIQWAQSVLETDLLPHISTKPEGITRKAYFVGYMVNRLIQGSLGRAAEDDRDYYGKKRMDMAGALLSNLFRQQFRIVVEDMKKSVEKELNQGKKEFNIQNAIKADTITRGLRSALATGNWGRDKQGDVQKTGVAQVLNRLTFASSLSHLRRLNTPLAKSGKLSKPRQLHNSHWGMVCPAETPEGQACGLVKNLSLMALVSVGSPTKILADQLEDQGVEDLSSLDPKILQHKDMVKVFVNGNWFGCHRNASKLIDDIKNMRRHQLLPKEISIVRDITKKEIKFFTDSGRVQRPLYIVEKS